MYEKGEDLWRESWIFQIDVLMRLEEFGTDVSSVDRGPRSD